ncbi:MAG: acetyl-CoA carboxylase biotin carboxyl carrier protein subunit [Telmatospirillum sp.]|nr:acetyl-CoA carboxylase biotin carboxyl carrier protein subunit [Telmatospirillum sp.]
MLRKFKINVEGRSYNVVVEEEGGVAQRPEPAAPTLVSSTPAPAPSAPPPVIAAATIVAQAPVAAGAGDVVAPLAGVIDSIEVRVGQTVNVGDKVAVLEAMKMKTDVFAKVAGPVSRIAVKTGDSVDTGQVLVAIG